MENEWERSVDVLGVNFVYLELEHLVEKECLGSLLARQVWVAFQKKIHPNSSSSASTVGWNCGGRRLLQSRR